MSALSKQSDVFRLPQPKEGEAVYFDEGKPSERAAGLGLRVRAAGSRKFVFFYRLGGRQLKYTIGDATAWTLDAARTEARKLRVQVEKGENPAATKAERTEASRLLFSSVADDYLKAKARVMRPRSLYETTRHLRRDWKALHGLPVGGVTRPIVASRLRTIAEDSGPVAADRARSTLSALYAWCIGEGLCDTNPVMGTNKASDGKARDRVLSDPELVAVWKAAADSDYGRIVQLLLLTGQRREEIGGLSWSEIDTAGKLIVLPGGRTKNHRAHEVPLSDLALDVLEKQPRRKSRELVFGEGEGPFSGWSQAKDKLAEAAKLKQPWTLHDIRRTVATRMADLGVAPHIVEAVLNHVSGHKAGVAGIYNRSSYAGEKRAALELWANHLKVEIAKAEGANVHHLKKSPKARA